MADVAKEYRALGGHRGRITKMITIVNHQFVENIKKGNRLDVKKFYLELKEKLDTLNNYDEQILDLVSAKKDGDVEKEVDDASKYKEDLLKAIISCKEVLNGQQKEHVVIKETKPEGGFKSVWVKLPKLEAKTFDGKAYEWQEFWDYYKSSVNEDEQLGNI